MTFISNNISVENLLSVSGTVVSDVYSGLTVPAIFYGSGEGLTNIKSYLHNRITVGSGTTGDFQSVKAAIDSISGNSSTNRFCVDIGPGIFVEDTITMKSFVSVRGCGRSTVIQVDSPAKDAIILVGNSFLDELIVDGATDTGKALLTVTASMGPGVSATVKNIRFGNGHTLFRSSLSAGQFAIVTFNNCITNIGTTFTNGIDVNGVNTVISFSDSKSSINSSVTDLFHIRGAGNRLILSDCGFLVQAALGGSVANAVRIYNSAVFDASAVGIDGATTGIFNENTGPLATIRCIGTSILNTTTDINIAHPSTVGYFNGIADSNKVSIDLANTSFNANYTVPGGGTVITGNFILGNTDSELTNVSDLILRGGILGKYSGGTITINTGLTINVDSGNGYVTSVATNPKKVTWSGVTGLVVPENSIRYVSVDENNSIVLQSNTPDLVTKIVLGRVITDSTKIVSVNNTAVNGRHYTSELERYRRDILGTDFKSGCVTSENVTPKKLNVTSGVYYFSNVRFTPTGSDAIKFTPVYRSSTPGQWIYSTTGDTIPNDKYDNGSGTLANLSAGTYVKHSLYINGSGADEKYFLLYGQTGYTTQLSAEESTSQLTPDGWDEGIGKLSEIVILASGSSISSILDKRNFSLGSTGGGTSNFHGSLLGLSTDDHTQYLLSDGTRPMSGNLAMGSNQITGAGLINGVTIQTHGSRHLPNGADPVSTGGTPVSVSTSNDIGIANAFARSDHQHAIADNTVGNNVISAHTSTKITITGKSQLNSAIVYNDQANVYGDFPQTFRTSRLSIRNPANTFSYSIDGSAITTGRTITLPLLIANDTLVTENHVQTLSGKTINATNNTISDTSQALGDLFKNNGSKFVRFPRGSALQYLRVNSGATDLEYAALGGELTGAVSFLTNISASLTASVNDFNPTGFATAFNVRLTQNNRNYSITGMLAGSNGRQIRLHNAGIYGVKITNEDVLSSAANRFSLPGGQDFYLHEGVIATFHYSSTTLRWILASINTTDFISKQPFGSYAANSVVAIRSADEVTAISAVGAIQPIGFAIRASAAAAETNVQISGIIGGFTGLTPSGLVYLSQSTPGAITQTEPITGRKVIMGVAYSTTSILIGIKDLGDSSAGLPSTTIVTGTTTITTTSTTPITMTSMSITPTAGNYQVWFSTSLSNNTNGGSSIISISVAGVELPASVRTLRCASNSQTGIIVPSNTTSVVTVNGSQAITGSWYQAGGSTATAYERSIVIMKVQ